MNHDSETVGIALARPVSYWPLLLFFGLLILPVLVLVVLFFVHDEMPLWIFLTTVLLLIGIAFLIGRRRGDLRDWNTVPYINLHSGKLIAVPAKRFNFGPANTEVDFPPGSRLEYHVETGDMFFAKDHGQRLRSTLWVIEPEGRRTNVPLGASTYINPTVAAANLKNAGIEMRIVKVYDGQDGEHTEFDVTPDTLSQPRRPVLKVVAGLSSLWVGVLAGLFVRSISLTVAVGLAAFAVVAAFELVHSDSRRTKLVSVAMTIPSYAAGYAVMVAVARRLVH